MSEAEDIVLKLLAAHTPPGRCPLAGNSVDQVILLQCRYGTLDQCCGSKYIEFGSGSGVKL